MENRKMKDLLIRAQNNGYAVAAINVSNMETAAAVLSAAHKCEAPIILQIAPIQKKIQEFNYEELVVLIRSIAKRYEGQYSIHLDHSDSIDECKKAISAGFNSIMYDGSRSSLKNNIKNTVLAKELCKEDITLEGEVGVISGNEGENSECKLSIYTDPKIAKEYVDRTNVDCLAVSIGNAHGLYKGQPNLNFSILREIKDIVKVPLVLHGASGLDEDQIKESIKNGICKINFFTEIDMEFTKTLAESISKGSFMMQACKDAQDAMEKKVIKIINMCGSEGKAKC